MELVQRRNSNIKYQFLAFVFIFICFVAFAYLIYQALKTNKAYDQSREGIENLEIMTLKLHRGESDIRGYILTGDEDLLNTSIKERISNIKINLDKAEKLLTIDPVQKHNFRSLEKYVIDRLKLIREIRQNDSIYNNKRITALIAEGDDIMDKIYPVMNTIKEIEHEKLKRIDKDLRSLLVSIIITVPLLVLFSLWLYVMAHKQSSHLTEVLKYEKQKMADERSYYQFLFNSNPSKLFVMDQHFKVVDANDILCNTFGLDRNEFIGSHIKNTIFNNELIDIPSLLEKQKEIKSKELIIKTSIGEEKAVLMSVHPFIQENRLLASITDITKQKQWNEEIRAAEKLSLTGNMARSIAHEVRNPLTNINLAVNELQDELSQDQLELTELISRNSDRIGTLISDLLTASKNKELAQSEFRLSALVNKTQQLVKDRVLLKGIKLNTINTALNNDKIKANFEDLQTAVLNLIINATEAIDHDKGTIDLLIENKGGTIRLTITDNGAGMSKETLGKIFNPFFTSKSKGNGLGLTSVQNTISSYGGIITAQSKLGEGSIFTIRFPQA